MLSAPTKPEIEEHTIKLIVGLMAISLGSLTSFFSASSIPSISASYYEGGTAQAIFVGFLFAEAALLVSYNGQTRTEMILSKIASVAALLVALFPCGCGEHPQIVPYVHGISAAVMFVILAFFCYGFFERAKAKGHAQAKARASIYVLCGLAIVLSILLLAADHLFGGRLSASVPRLTFYGERTALIAFGISWLTASRVIPVLTRADERFAPLS